MKIMMKKYSPILVISALAVIAVMFNTSLIYAVFLLTVVAYNDQLKKAVEGNSKGINRLQDYSLCSGRSKIEHPVDSIVEYLKGDADSLNGSIDAIVNLEATEIFVKTNNLSYQKLFDLLEKLSEKRVDLVIASDDLKILFQKASSEIAYGEKVLRFKVGGINQFDLLLKRLSDVVLAGFGVLILMPFYLITALLIKITSKGPIIYKQVRVGKDGKEFNFYKFRSMYQIDGEDECRKEMMLEFMRKREVTDEDTKVINEDRITKIGRFLRKTSLDEMPQLFNVLAGKMSLVGPRPCLPYEYEYYEDWHKLRTKVIPGCTGLWQVSGRSKVSFTDSILLDLYYMYNTNPLMDLKIILKTLPVMFFSKGGK